MKTMTHIPSNGIISVISGLLTGLLIKFHEFYAGVTMYVKDISGVQLNLPNYSVKPVIMDESVVLICTIAGGVATYIITYLLKQILADPEALLTIRMNAIAEWWKFKKKKDAHKNRSI